MVMMVMVMMMMVMMMMVMVMVMVAVITVAVLRRLRRDGGVLDRRVRRRDDVADGGRELVCGRACVAHATKTGHNGEHANRKGQRQGNSEPMLPGGRAVE